MISKLGHQSTSTKYTYDLGLLLTLESKLTYQLHSSKLGKNARKDKKKKDTAHIANLSD